MPPAGQDLPRRNIVRMLAGALAGGAAFEASAQTSRAGGNGTTMADLSMTAEAVEGSVITQQSILLRLTLRNNSSAPQLVPDPQRETPFVYRIAGVDPGLPRFEVSAQTLRESLSEGTPAPVRPAPGFNLGAGFRSQRIDDVLQLLNRPLPPGTYDIKPRLERNGQILDTPPMRVTVVPPRPAALSTAVSLRARKRILAMIQPGATGRNPVLVQELEPGIRDLALFEPLAMTESSASSVAVSVEAAETGNMRWIAWLSGSTLHARLHHSLRIPPADQKIQVDAAEPRLAGPGFTTAEGAGIFVVRDRDGILVYRVHEEGSRLLWRMKGWTDATAEHLLIRHLGFGRQGDMLQFTWAEPGAHSRVLTQTFTLEGGKPLGAPVHLWTSPGPIRAWDAPLIGSKLGAALWVLSGSGSGQPHVVTRLRLPAARQEQRPEQFRLPPLPTEPKHWAITGLQAGYAVAASDGERLYVAPAGQTLEWLVKDKVLNAGRLRLTSVDRTSVWLEWLDPSFGFRLQKVS